MSSFIHRKYKNKCVNIIYAPIDGVDILLSDIKPKRNSKYTKQVMYAKV